MLDGLLRKEVERHAHGLYFIRFIIRKRTVAANFFERFSCVHNVKDIREMLSFRHTSSNDFWDYDTFTVKASEEDIELALSTLLDSMSFLSNQDIKKLFSLRD